MQRTVQYIAGAGIGYRVVQTITGSGTHNLPRPTAPQFGVFSQQSNDLPPESTFFDDKPNPGFSKGKTTIDEDTDDDDGGDRNQGRQSGQGSKKRGPGSQRGPKTPFYDENDVRPFNNVNNNSNRKPISHPPRRPLRPFDGPDPNEIIPEFVHNRPVTPTPPTPPQRYNNHRRTSVHHNVDLRPTAPPNAYPEYFGVNSIDFDKANIRAHVQNIDLLPITPRYPSPGDALKWDIISGN